MTSCLSAGDQVVADGDLVGSDGLRLDESILTGESTAASRGVGDQVRSGSFAVDGAGAYRVTAVGAESYAEQIASVARSSGIRGRPSSSRSTVSWSGS